MKFFQGPGRKPGCGFTLSSIFIKFSKETYATLFFLKRVSKYAYTSKPEKFDLFLLQLFQNRKVGAQPLQKQTLALDLRLKSVP